MTRDHLRRTAVIVLAVGALGPKALAQLGAAPDETPAATSTDVRPPAPTDPGKPSYIVPYVVLFLLGAAAVGLSVLPSARTHQD